MKYVLVDAIHLGKPRRVVLVLKKRPNWQAGHWNLPGGHIEDGESPWLAAQRELREETGIETCDLQSIGTINNTVEVFRALYSDQELQNPTDELAKVFSVTDLPDTILPSTLTAVGLSRIHAPYFDIRISELGNPHVNFPDVAKADLPLSQQRATL